MKSLEQILNESFNKRYLDEGIEDVKKYYQNIDDDKFMQIIALDPTYKEGVDKVGNYGKWLLNIYKKHNLKDEDFYKVNDYLQEFEDKRRWFKNKDIQQFKSLGELAKALDEVEVGELTANQKDKEFKRELKKTPLNAKRVFEGDGFEVWIPNEYESSCKLASNTEWCTGPSSKGNSGYYDHYTKEGPLYILINKQDKDEKYQFHFESSQFMDRYDDSISFWEFMEGHPSLSSYFTPIAIHTYCPEIENLKDNEDITIDCMLEDFLYSYKQCSHSLAVDADTVEDILCNTGENTFDVYTWEISYSDMTNALNYNKDKILQNETISNFLKEYNLSFEDFILTVEDNEDIELSENIKDAVERAYLDALQSGTVAQAYNDVTRDLEEAFYSIKGLSDSKVEISVADNAPDYTIYFTCQSDILKEWVLRRLENYEGQYITLPTEICACAADEFRCYEPRYGWNGFDSEFFVDILAEELSSI